MRWDRKDLIRNGYYAVYAFFLTTVVASAVLLQAFLRKDFSFGYVDRELRRQPLDLLPHRRLLGRASRARSCSGCCSSPS